MTFVYQTPLRGETSADGVTKFRGLFSQVWLFLISTDCIAYRHFRIKEWGDFTFFFKRAAIFFP